MSNYTTTAKLLLIGWLVLGFIDQNSAQEVSFNRDIRPILSENCYYCHGFDEQQREAGLRLDVSESARDVIEPGSPDDSELLLRIMSDDEGEIMPPPDSHKKRLSQEQIDVIRLWIQQGAVYEDHWAFVAPKRLATESGVNSVSSAIDYFINKELVDNGLKFAKPAAPAKWLRRMSLDLTGLPPGLEELDAFEKDVKLNGEAAYVVAVKRALSSAHFGERMALDWLDVARYADTNGFQQDAYRMNWPWRDWVMRAFNDNMPYDQFIIEQLAGDLLDDPTQDQLVATAFNRNHMINAEGGSIQAENLAKTAFDRIETTGTAFLGLTVGCCQCHDHKFDPLKQSDYYSLYAFFNQLDETGSGAREFSTKTKGQAYSKKYMIDKPYISIATDQERAQLELLAAETKKAKDQLEAARPEFEPEFITWAEEIRAKPELAERRIKPDYIRRHINTAPLDDPQNFETTLLTNFYLNQDKRWKPLRDAIEAATKVESEFQSGIPLVMIMRDDLSRETFILQRGNYETPGKKVMPEVPAFLPPLPEGMKANRLALAKWLVSTEHPLTSRVTVNRYWQLMFGRGLVSTPDDFGLQGALPTHPELLDWLAVEFRESGWNLKALLEGIVLSQAYRQTAAVDPQVIERDPDNRWLSRGSRQRLDSRLLRDQALALSGLLVSKIGGEPVAPYQPSGIWEEMSLNKNHYMRDKDDKLYRRSLYTVWRRVVAPANFFDVPSRQNCSVRQQRTNTPLHALTMLNDTTYIEAARVWATRLTGLSDDEAAHQTHFLYRNRPLSRPT